MLWSKSGDRGKGAGRRRGGRSLSAAISGRRSAGPCARAGSVEREVPRPPRARRRAVGFSLRWVSSDGVAQRAVPVASLLGWLARPASREPSQVVGRRSKAPVSNFTSRRGMAGRNQPKGWPEGGFGTGAFSASSSRRRGLWYPRGPFPGRLCFLGKNPSVSLGFPGRGIGFEKQKTHFREGSGLWRISVAPQLFHFLALGGGAFSRYYSANLPSGDGLHAHERLRALQMEGLGGQVVQRAVHGNRFMREACQQCVVAETVRNKPKSFQGLSESFFCVSDFDRRAGWAQKTKAR